MNTEILVIGTSLVIAFAVIVVRDVRKQRKGGTSSDATTKSKKSSASLQDYLPLQGFHEESGAMIVNGRFHRMIRVGDVNLYSLNYSEIKSLRDKFKEMVVHLQQPFQISVQARRANYTDYLQDAKQKIDDANAVYQNDRFKVYSEGLKAYLSEEVAKPRTDRENLVITGVVPKLGGSEEKVQIEELNRETEFVLEGLQGMRVPFRLLHRVEILEAIQNFWSRDRAVSQRYRDAMQEGVHTSRVDGEKEVNQHVS